MRPTHRRSLLFRLVALLLLAAAPAVACRPSAPPEAPMPDAPTSLRVENRGFADMVIYIMAPGGARQRLGIATGSSTSSFALPKTMIYRGTVRFLADPIGGQRSPISDEINIRPGDEVVLTIPPG
jgi:hypothetical protein